MEILDIDQHACMIRTK